jgi:hypothetical protein
MARKIKSPWRGAGSAQIPGIEGKTLSDTDFTRCEHATRIDGFKLSEAARIRIENACALALGTIAARHAEFPAADVDAHLKRIAKSGGRFFSVIEQIAGDESPAARAAFRTLWREVSKSGTNWGNLHDRQQQTVRAARRLAQRASFGRHKGAPRAHPGLPALLRVLHQEFVRAGGSPSISERGPFMRLVLAVLDTPALQHLRERELKGKRAALSVNALYLQARLTLLHNLKRSQTKQNAGS